MKTKLRIVGVTLAGIILTSCSSSMHMSSSTTPADDIYYTPSNTSNLASTSTLKQESTVDDNTQNISESKYAMLEKKYSYASVSDTVKSDTLVAKVDNRNPYESILSNSYKESYERRLRGMEDPKYGIEDFTVRYSDAYWLAQSYDPSLYHIVIMGDQVWVEPWYISTMFNWPHSHFSFGFAYGYNNWAWNPWYYDYYYSPFYWSSSWVGYNPYWYGGYPYYNNYYINDNDNYYYGHRSGGTSNYTTNRRTGTSIENQIISSRRRGGITTQNNTFVNSRNRNTNQNGIVTRNTITNQEVTHRGGNRNLDLNTTRLRNNDGNTTRTTTNMTEPTRRNNYNTYQRPRSTNNEEYNRSTTRNRNTNTNATSRDNTRNPSTIRDNRNTSPTYNRPSRVESSSTRERSSSSGNSGGGSNYTRSSSGSSSSGSSSSSSRNNSSSGGSGSRRR